MIRAATINDVPAIREIYNYYVLNTLNTLESDPISETEMQGRVATAIDNYACLVFTDSNDNIVAFAYAMQWRLRAPYKKTVELTIYVQNGITGKGIGKQLYAALIDALKLKGVHSLIGGVIGDNEVSDKLHEVFGFKKIARFKENGLKFDQWHDVSYWQLLL